MKLKFSRINYVETHDTLQRVAVSVDTHDTLQSAGAGAGRVGAEGWRQRGGRCTSLQEDVSRSLHWHLRQIS